jgi:hypothetical protein
MVVVHCFDGDGSSGAVMKVVAVAQHGGGE